MLYFDLEVALSAADFPGGHLTSAITGAFGSSAQLPRRREDSVRFGMVYNEEWNLASESHQLELMRYVDSPWLVDSMYGKDSIHILSVTPSLLTSD